MVVILPRLILVSLASVLITVPAASTETLKLSREDCDFIWSYNQHYRDHDFPFLVGHMARTLEWCQTGLNCTVPFKKRTEDFYVTTYGHRSGSSISEVYGDNMAYFSNFLFENTGLRFFPSTIVDDDTLSRIHIIFVNPNIATDDLSAADEWLDFFVSNDDLMCIGLGFDWMDRPTEYSEVFIKSDIEPEILANCLKEEVYNTSGVPGDPMGLDSIFSSTPFSGKKVGPPIFEEFSRREAIVMKLVYDPRMKTGQLRPETEKIANELIGSACE